jgi:hypothetical protein
MSVLMRVLVLVLDFPLATYPHPHLLTFYVLRSTFLRSTFSLSHLLHRFRLSFIDFRARSFTPAR